MISSKTELSYDNIIDHFCSMYINELSVISLYPFYVPVAKYLIEFGLFCVFIHVFFITDHNFLAHILLYFYLFCAVLFPLEIMPRETTLGTNTHWIITHTFLVAE